jgi:hypothetical protein
MIARRAVKLLTVPYRFSVLNIDVEAVGAISVRRSEAGHIVNQAVVLIDEVPHFTGEFWPCDHFGIVCMAWFFNRFHKQVEMDWLQVDQYRESRSSSIVVLEHIFSEIALSFPYFYWDVREVKFSVVCRPTDHA